MAPRRKSKGSDEKTEENNSNNAREAPKMSTPVPTDSLKTPKVNSRRVNGADRTPLPTTSLFDLSFSPPSSSHAGSSRSADTSGKKEVKCAFYRTERGEDGTYRFSKSLLKYFMTCDSPEMADLKAGRRNTSFLRETPRGDRDIQIYTPEEDKDPKYYESMPHIVSNMPDVPGTECVDVFKSIPIGDSDEDLKLLRNGNLLRKKLKAQNKNSKKRISLRCTAYKGKPLPDESLLFDYTGLFDSDSSNDSKHDKVDTKVKEKKERRKAPTKKKSILQSTNKSPSNGLFDSDSSNDSKWDKVDTKVKEKKQRLKGPTKKKSILHSLLKSPSDVSVRPYQYNSINIPQDVSRRQEDEKLLEKYKNVLGNKRLRVVIEKLPTSDQSLQSSGKKKVKFTTDLEGKKIYGVKKHADKALIKSKAARSTSCK